VIKMEYHENYKIKNLFYFLNVLFFHNARAIASLITGTSLQLISLKVKNVCVTEAR